MKDASIQLACGQPGAQEGDWAGYVRFCANPQECGCSQQQSRKAGPGSTLYRAFPWAGSTQSVLPMRAVADLGITYTYYLDSTPKSSKVAVLHL